MSDSKLQSLGSLGSKAKQIVANVATYFLLESKKETSPASYIRRTVEATGGSRTMVFKIRKEWLPNRGIPFRENLLKPQLLELARAHKPPPFYVIDQLISLNGHEVLRLPPYHPEFNAINGSGVS